MVNKKTLIANAALLLLSIVLTYIVLEVAYRYYWYEHLSTQLVDTLYQMGRQRAANTTATFDPEYGYRYLPNRIWQNTAYHHNRWRTNQYGLIADDIDRSSYAKKKPAGEFRIAVLGDSFAAGNAVYLRWPDLLQDYLNRSPEWRTLVGGKFTRVLNFGMDGTGVVQWAPVYEFRARPFAPDMVIVSYFIDDVMRQFVFRGHHTFKSDRALRAFVEKSVHHALQRLPWYGIYPELLAATVGKYIGLPRHLMPTTAVTSPRFSSQAEGIRESVAALARIRCLNPRTIVVKQPAFEELKDPKDDGSRWPSMPDLVGLKTKFERAAAAKGIRLVNITDFGGTILTRRQVRALYNLPLDTHMSDYGVVMYASWTFKYLMKWAHRADLMAAVTPSCR